MPQIQILNPAGLGTPLAQYSQVARVKASELLFIAGQVSTNAAGDTVGAGDFDAQCVQVFRNIGIALAEVGAGWQNVVQFTTYLVHSQDIPRLGAFRTREFPAMFGDRAYPTNTLLMIDRLLREDFLIEVQAIAAL
ncbi:enodribonuclease L-PSP [Pigmentiphaga sp. NML080357]|uniref:RidA family protein n=1 Tax=Pigmentiphaga sp. NML080357 TaxID=2008675 RepID=UPI000B41EE65|nr:RidA family protein [Pigmentiphaga sp. NML080357]OVZ64868.1 enodribonuclease L-PSP [Pigmentiphaga sp. NML080357]